MEDDQGGRPEPSVDAAEALIEGRAKAADVVALTRLFDDVLLWGIPEPRDRDDRDFAEYLGLTANQALQRIRKDGLTGETAVRQLKKLFRTVSSMLSAYRTKKKRYPPAEWLSRAARLMEELKDVG